MSLWGKLFGKTSAESSEQEWVAVCFRLTNGEFGSSEEREGVHRFTDTLGLLIQERQVGVFDGDEYGNGEGSLYMYGPNADRLFDAIYSELKGWAPLKGGYAIKRYGIPERSERIEF